MIDNILFGVILAISEIVIITAAGKWFPGQLYTVSAAAAVTAIAMMRWGIWSALHAALAGIVYVGVQGGTFEQLLIYVLGNELSLAALLLIKAAGREKIKDNVLLTVLYALTVQLLMQAGRGVGASPKFITMDILSELFTVLIVFIASRLDGIFEDQKTYLLRMQQKDENQNGEDQNG